MYPGTKPGFSGHTRVFTRVLKLVVLVTLGYVCTLVPPEYMHIYAVNVLFCAWYFFSLFLTSISSIETPFCSLLFFCDHGLDFRELSSYNKFIVIIPYY